MKFNQWTLGLAALGVVSLASAAKAEEKMSAVQSALSSTTISGYVDTSAQWNFGTGNDNMPPYKFGGTTKADGFNLNVVQLSISKPLDEAEWAAGYRADLWFGPDANTLGTQSTLSAGSGDLAIRQAYVALRMPVGNGIDWKVGVFDSIIGYESVQDGNNPNHTRSYGHSIEPQTMTGVLATYRFSDMVSLSGGIANTVGPAINQRAFASPGSDGNKAESFKSYMASLALTAPDSWGWAKGSTLYGGFVCGYNDNLNGSAIEDNTISYYAGLTMATPLEGLKVGAAFDYLKINNYGYDAYAWAIGGYVSYQATEKLSFHGRVEYFEETAGVLDLIPSGGKGKIGEMTATIQYDLWKNVMSRLEFRWDHDCTGNGQFGGSGGTSGGNPQVNATMVAANIIYNF